MKVNTYSSFLDDDGHSYLVKEHTYDYPKETYLNDSAKIVTLMNELFYMDKLDTEHVYMLCTNIKCRPTAIFHVSSGTVNKSLISPREILIKALLSNSVNIIIVHNHPSGSSWPSKEDHLVTKRLKEACEIIGLNLVDHIIISGNESYSFAQRHLL